MVKDKYEQRVQGYYTTFSSCLDSYIQERLKKSKAKKNNEVLMELEDIRDRISKLYKFIEENSSNVYIGTLNRLLKGKIDLDTLDDSEED